MVQLSLLFLGLVAAASVEGAPMLSKRIAQVISASTTKWEQACLAAGGQQCNPLSIAAFTTLLAAAGPCEQQDAADNMIDLGKKLNSAQMITLTQIFTQQPRNTPNSVAVPYCQKAPRNTELNGLFQCQFQGANQKVFVGGVAVGGAGTIPFGRNAPLNPLGSCPANPGGPIADGTQLVDLTQNPGAGNTPAPGNTPAASVKPAPSPAKSQTPVADASPAPAPAGGAGGFKLQNGQDAQALNKKFAGLTSSSSCAAGENACVNGGFAQCVGAKFAVAGCAPTLTCAALPLVNSRGTSVTCTTPADALARIQATGATGGISG